MERDDIYTNMTTMWIQGLDTSWLNMEKAQKHAQRNDMWKKKILRKMLENGKYYTTVICWLSRKEETKNGFLR